MGYYTLEPNTNYKKWSKLSTHLNSETIKRIMKDDINICQTTFQNDFEKSLCYSKFDLKKPLFSEIGTELTKNYLDKIKLRKIEA